MRPSPASRPLVSAALLLLATAPLPAQAGNASVQALEKADALFRAATNHAAFAEAARAYQSVAEDGNIRNGYLYYNTGNAWYMAGDLGRAILYYRRAERYLPADPDVRENLQAARSQRIDSIPEKGPPPVLARLLGWHFHTATRTRGWVFAILWIACWGAWFAWKSRGSANARRLFVVTALPAALLLGSLAADAVAQLRDRPGVIVAEEVVARKGDGAMYHPAFLAPLHAGTEFQLLEQRDGWWKIRLPDGQTCWIPARSARLVRA